MATHHASYCKFLTHASRHEADPATDIKVQAFRDPKCTLLVAARVDCGKKVDTAASSHHSKQLRLSWQVAHPLSNLKALMLAIQSICLGTTTRWSQVAHQTTNERGLASAVRTKQSENGSFWYRKATFI